MYAIIRTGGKQAKVHEGDVLDVERLRGDGEVSFTPLLVVADDGTVISGREALAEVKVVAKILGPSSGPKVDIFKYKAKTGYRRRQGHRQKYTQIEVTRIDLPGAGKASGDGQPDSKAAASETAATAAEKPPADVPAAAEEAASNEPAAAEPAAQHQAAKKPAAKKPAAKKPAETAAAKKPAAKKPAAKKPAAKKPAAKDPDAEKEA